MNLRPLAVVATALACAFATPSTAGAGVAMDGVRRTHVAYKGSLTELAYNAGPDRVTSVPVDPAPADCTTKAACDLTSVRLTVPKGSTAGRFRVTLTMPRDLNGAVALFNTEGERVAKADLLENGEALCCDVTWKVSFVVARLAPGQYTLVVFNRGGAGEFTADLDFKAYPPDRQRGKR